MPVEGGKTGLPLHVTERLVEAPLRVVGAAATAAAHRRRSVPPASGGQLSSGFSAGNRSLRTRPSREPGKRRRDPRRPFRPCPHRWRCTCRLAVAARPPASRSIDPAARSPICVLEQAAQGGIGIHGDATERNKISGDPVSKMLPCEYLFPIPVTCGRQ